MTTELKRILALSGGGVRGIVEVAYLEALEEAYRSRLGEKTRLCDVFDLIGGTSTGALVATALALGHPLSSIKDFYLRRATEFFRRRRWWAFGQSPVFDSAGLEREIRADIGEVTLGSAAFQTRLAIVTKRLDTGSTWVVSNLPDAPYFDDPPDGSYVGNRHFDVAQLLRASTAAPTLFQQQTLKIAGAQTGVFVDGGLSPYNDPSLALLQLARMRAFGLNWDTSADRLYIVAIGTGRYRQRVPAPLAARLGPLRTALLSLRGMMLDAEQHSLTMMEWMGTTRKPSLINSEIRHLADECLAAEPLFSYLRLDLPLEAAALRKAGLEVAARDVRALRRIDAPDGIAPLYELAKSYIARSIGIDDLIDADPLLRDG